MVSSPVDSDCEHSVFLSSLYFSSNKMKTFKLPKYVLLKNACNVEPNQDPMCWHTELICSNITICCPPFDKLSVLDVCPLWPWWGCLRLELHHSSRTSSLLKHSGVVTVFWPMCGNLVRYYNDIGLNPQKGVNFKNAARVPKSFKN